MLDGQTIEITISQCVGLLGAAMYSTGYFLLAFDKLRSDSPKYFAMQFVAASCMLVSLVEDFNIGALCIQLFFVTVSVIGVARHLRGRNGDSKSSIRANSFAGLVWSTPVPGSPRAPLPAARPDL